MYKAEPFLDEKSLLALYFLYIHSHVSYANLAWAWYGGVLTGQI